MFTFSVPPVVVMHGPTDVKFGSNVSIRCAVLEGYPSPSVSIITPQGEIINQSVISFNATMNDAGNYTCTANNSLATVTSNLSLTVYSKNFTTNDCYITVHNADWSNFCTYKLFINRALYMLSNHHDHVG